MFVLYSEDLMVNNWISLVTLAVVIALWFVSFDVHSNLFEIVNIEVLQVANLPDY